MNVERGEVGATGVPRLASPGGSYVGTALLARSVWIILAVTVMGLNLLGIPYAYVRYAKICIHATQVCSQEGMLTPEAVQRLRELGLSVGLYGAYNGVAIPIVTTLVFVAVALVLYQRRSDDRCSVQFDCAALVWRGVLHRHDARFG